MLKDKVDVQSLRSRAEEYQIRFEGPVHNSEWPSQHNFEVTIPNRHRFSIIRDIAALDYDDFKKRRNLSRGYQGSLINRAEDLREEAYLFRKHGRPNESTWRTRLRNSSITSIQDQS